jgi:cytochrome P450
VIVSDFFNSIPKEKYANVNILEEAQCITGEVIARLFFGDALSVTMVNGKSLILELGELLGLAAEIGTSPACLLFGTKFLKLGLFPHHRKLMTRILNFRTTFYGILQEEKAKFNCRDSSKSKANDTLLYMFFEQQLTQIVHFKDWEIIDQFIVFFGGGMDTTAHLITMMIYSLTQAPDVLAKLELEVQKIYKNISPEDFTMDKLNEMTYLAAFIKETMRMYTVSGSVYNREAVNDHYLAGFRVKKGTLLSTPFALTDLNPKFHDDPDVFNVERWLDPNSKSAQNGPFCFLQFAAGPRNCIGQHLALNETKIIMAEFLSKFAFKLIEPYRLRLILKFTPEPIDPIMISLSRRELTSTN